MRSDHISGHDQAQKVGGGLSSVLELQALQVNHRLNSQIADTENHEEGIHTHIVVFLNRRDILLSILPTDHSLLRSHSLGGSVHDHLLPSL